jgi:sulfur carrier protein
MDIKINGEERQTKSKTVGELLTELNIMPARVAVEVNLRIIKKADYPTYELKDGDTVEIVNFVGGG